MLYLVIFECEVLEEGSSVGLDRVQAVIQHGNNLRKLWLSPRSRRFSQCAVQRSHASSLHCHRDGPGVWLNAAYVTVQSVLAAPVKVDGSIYQECLFIK